MISSFDQRESWVLFNVSIETYDQRIQKLYYGGLLSNIKKAAILSDTHMRLTSCWCSPLSGGAR